MKRGQAVVTTYDSTASVGKTLPQHLYIHRKYLSTLPDESRLLVAQALRFAGEFSFDIVKIARDGSHVSLLSYPEFDSNPHPALTQSIRIKLPSGQHCITNYTLSKNPPILHRKETFVGTDYPLYKQFAALTEAEASAGLLSRHDIGTQQQWKLVLQLKNLKLKGHSLVKTK